LDRIRENFTESIQTKIAAAEVLSESIQTAAQMLAICLLNGNKILACGNGASAALAQLFVSHLMSRFETTRPSLPAIALTCDGNLMSSLSHYGQFEDVYAHQIRALGQQGDILVLITTEDDNQELIHAAEAALSRDMTMVILNTGYGGELAGLLGQSDVEIRCPSARFSRILEVHLLVLNCLSDLIDQTLFPQ
jgi:DnaA initiator-associating protein